MSSTVDFSGYIVLISLAAGTGATSSNRARGPYCFASTEHPAFSLYWHRCGHSITTKRFSGFHSTPSAEKRKATNDWSQQGFIFHHARIHTWSQFLFVRWLDGVHGLFVYNGLDRTEPIPEPRSSSYFNCKRRLSVTRSIYGQSSWYVMKAGKGVGNGIGKGKRAKRCDGGAVILGIKLSQQTSIRLLPANCAYPANVLPISKVRAVPGHITSVVMRA